MKAVQVPERVVNEVNSLFYRFIWRKQDCNRRAFEKVKRVVLCNEIEKGGLKMIDLRNLQTVCLLEWAVELLRNSDQKWSFIARRFFIYFGEKCVCFEATVSSKAFKGLDTVKSKFWSSVLVSWLDNNMLPNEMISYSLWNNRYIKYCGNVLYFRDWVVANIRTVKDVVNNAGLCLTYDEVCAKIGNSPSR